MAARQRRHIQSVAEVIRQTAREREGLDARAASRAADRAARTAQQIAKAELREFDRMVAAKARARAKEEREILRTADRAIKQERRDAAKAGANRYQFLSSVGQSTAGMLQRGVGVAGSIARGMGVNFDLSSSIGRGVELEKRARQLSNTSYQQGAAGAAGIRQDPKQLMKEARAVGDASALDPVKVMEGMQAFAAKTGDLATAREIIGDLGKLSRATGTEMQDMVGAAGEVAKTLGDVPDKGKKTLAIVKAIAAQGKVGSVEMSDFAKRLGKAASSAANFEGGAEKNIAVLAALAQLATGGGGASNAAEGATAAAGFVNTIGTKARRKHFKAADVKLENAQGQKRNPIDIILDSIQAAGNDEEKWTGMWGNIKGRQPPAALRAKYLEAGGGEKGMAAARAEAEKLVKANMGEGEIADSFKESMEGIEAKAQLFQNRLDAIAASLADRVLPAFEKMAPTALRAVEGLAGLVSWAANNPMTAVTAALATSIGKVALGSALESAIKGSIGGAGGLSLAIAAGTIAVAAATIYMQEKRQAATKRAEEEVDASVKATMDAVDRGDKDALAKQALRNAVNRADADAFDPNETSSFFHGDAEGMRRRKIMNQSKGALDREASDIANAGGPAIREGLMSELIAGGKSSGGFNAEDVRAAIEAGLDMKGLEDKLGGTLKVEITNLPGGSALGPNPPGRVP